MMPKIFIGRQSHVFVVAFYICALILSALFFTNWSETSDSAQARPANPAPVLFFSDLDWGPKTGWEGSTTKGAAVSVWGKNFGATRGSSYITVNGAKLTADSDYAEWGVTGLSNGVARGMERTTFWVNNSATDGAGNITITVNGVTSNALPFTVANGAIYFISVSGGNNSYNGRYSSATGGNNGPFKDLWKFNPCGSTDPMHSSGSCNPSQDGQYIAYVRAGTYTALDVDDTFIALRGPYGGPDKRKALVGYPGEMPVINTANAERGIAWNAMYSPYGFNSYFTYAKLTGINGGAPFGAFGSYNRYVGNTFKDYLIYAQAGIIQVTNSKYTSILGNIFDHNGNDSMKHNVYIKTEYTGVSGVDSSTLYTYVGWNEFMNAVASDTHGGVVFVSKSGDSQIASYATDYVYIHDNYFHDGQMDFIYFGDNVNLGGNMFVYNNIFKGGTSSNGGITMYDGTTNVYFYNNTFYQMGPTSLPMAWQTGNSHSYWKNNIWYMGNGQSAFALESYKGGTANFDHDLFYNGSAPSGSNITVTNALTGDPKFTNTASNDYYPLTGSAVVDTGSSAVSSIVTTDYEGVARPAGSGFDLGAFEYLVGTGTPIQTCSDGTAYSVCSATKPKYCSAGTLVDRASTCGCPTGQTVSGETCITPVQTCSDGTAYSACSTTKPKYCSNGTLVDRASTCGCPTGQTVSGEACVTTPAVDATAPKVVTFTLRTRANTDAATFDWSVTDNVTLARAELWRAPSVSGQCATGQWVMVSNQTKTLSGLSGSGTFSDTPADGTWCYGLHAVDATGNLGLEPNPPGPITIVKSAVVQTCSDGTAYSACSTTKPKYCSNGTLVDRASTCGCPTGQTVSGEICVTTPTADTAAPTIVGFDVQPRQTSGSVTITWSATDAGGSHLAQVEIWRAPDNNGAPGTWQNLTSLAKNLSSQNLDSSSGSATDNPANGTWWYGFHVRDGAQNVTYEPSPPGALKVVKSTTTSAPNVTLALSANRTSAVAGQDITYTLVYTNTGSAIARNIILTSAVPAGVTYVTGSATGSNFSFSNNTLSWRITSLAAGASGRVTYRLRVNLAACPDADGDGVAALSCGGTDCNDTSRSIYPGAGEICGNGIDENCDGQDTACSGQAGVCPNGKVTSTCTCGTRTVSTDYCCNGNWQSRACAVGACPNGAVTATCLCGNYTVSSDYCCNGSWQSRACSTTGTNTNTNTNTGTNTNTNTNSNTNTNVNTNSNTNTNTNTNINTNTNTNTGSSVCPNGKVTSTCTCGTRTVSTDYCCNGNWQSGACAVGACPNGAVTAPCVCGNYNISSDYCCDGNWQSVACQ